MGQGDVGAAPSWGTVGWDVAQAPFWEDEPSAHPQAEVFVVAAEPLGAVRTWELRWEAGTFCCVWLGRCFFFFFPLSVVDGLVFVQRPWGETREARVCRRSSPGCRCVQRRARMEAGTW